jgi:hypothetical protein
VLAYSASTLCFRHKKHKKKAFVTQSVDWANGGCGGVSCRNCAAPIQSHDRTVSNHREHKLDRDTLLSGDCRVRRIPDPDISSAHSRLIVKAITTAAMLNPKKYDICGFALARPLR